MCADGKCDSDSDMDGYHGGPEVDDPEVDDPEVDEPEVDDPSYDLSLSQMQNVLHLSPASCLTNPLVLTGLMTQWLMYSVTLNAL